jgi:hypothetical protein
MKRGMSTTNAAPMIGPVMVAAPPMSTTARKSIDSSRFQRSGV